MAIGGGDDTGGDGGGTSHDGLCDGGGGAAAGCCLDFCGSGSVRVRWWSRSGLGEPEQKLFPTEMALDGSTFAALHTAVAQSRTPKAKFMLLQRQL